MKSFFAGAITLLVIEMLGAYLFLALGGVPLATKAPPLPLEEKAVGVAFSAYLSGTDRLQPPIFASEDHLATAAKIYKEQCAFCHGLPNRIKPTVAIGMFPAPPQLFTKEENVAAFPVGSVYWIIKNGIRLSGMPSFEHHLKDGEIWGLSLLLRDFDKIPPGLF